MIERRTVLAFLGAGVLAILGGVGHSLVVEGEPRAAESAETTPASTTTPTSTTVSTATTTTQATTTTTAVPGPAAVARQYVDAVARLDDNTAHSLLCDRRRAEISVADFTASVDAARRELGLRSGTVEGVLEQQGQVLVDMALHYGATTYADVVLVPDQDGQWGVCEMVGFDFGLDMVWPRMFGGRR